MEVMWCGVWEIPLPLRGRRTSAVISTGCASPAFEAALPLLGRAALHPWLQACAPLGRGGGGGSALRVHPDVTGEEGGFDVRREVGEELRYGSFVGVEAE